MSRNVNTIRRDAATGLPCLTDRQRERAHKYAIEVMTTGTSKRVVTFELLACALCEASYLAFDMREKLQQFVIGAAHAAPAKEVARLAVSMLMRLRALPDEASRDAYLRMMLGDDDDSTSHSASKGTSTRH